MQTNKTVYTNLNSADWTRTSLFTACIENINKRRTVKPTDYGRFTTSLNKGEFLTDITLYDACRRIEYGGVWTAAKLRKKCDDGFIVGQFIAIDIDNKKNDNSDVSSSPITLQMVLDKAGAENLPPLFYYHTFSHTEECPRFRVVWMLESPIDDAPTYRAIQSYLIDLFDTDRCRDVSRFWVGGNDLRITEKPVCLSSSTIDDLLGQIERKNPFSNKGNRRKSVDGQSANSTNDDLPTLKRVDKELVLSRCELWRRVVDIDNPYWAEYADILRLALSAYRMSGFQTMLRDAIRRNSQFYNNDKHKVDYYLDVVSSVRRYESEQRCNSGCPFYNECQHLGFIYDMAHVREVIHYPFEPTEHIPLEDAQQRLHEPHIRRCIDDVSLSILHVRSRSIFHTNCSLIHTQTPIKGVYWVGA